MSDNHKPGETSVFSDLIKEMSDLSFNEAVLCLVRELNLAKGVMGMKGALAAVVNSSGVVRSFCEFSPPEPKFIKPKEGSATQKKYPSGFVKMIKLSRYDDDELLGSYHMNFSKQNLLSAIDGEADAMDTQDLSSDFDDAKIVVETVFVTKDEYDNMKDFTGF